MINSLLHSLLKDYASFRKYFLISIILTGSSDFISGQTIHPDLGLHGQLTWLSDTKIRVEYDWSDESQLLDWTTTNGSSLVRGNGSLTISDGVASVRSMIWKQPMKCTRIQAQDAKAINSPIAHLNFITNVSCWSGYNFNPLEIIGAIFISNSNIWTENGTSSSLPAPPIMLGNKYTIEVIVSETTITCKSSSNNIVYSHNLTAPPDPDRQVAVGGWGGDTEWGKLTVEGEIDVAWKTPDEMIDILSGGASFSPVIEVTGNPVIEWIFDDGTTSSTTSPVKLYGSIGVRHNLLKVTPWSALTGINVGYDAADGGYGGFAMVEKQDILGFRNLSLANTSLKYLCASYSPLSDLDLTEFSSLEFVELVMCWNLGSLILGTHPLLERICVEDCNLSSLNLSGCTGLEDIRGANNRYESINWGATGTNIWHICVRSNPQFTVNMPALTQFPLLKELLIWDDNQNGVFECHSSVIQRIDAYDNHYTGADLSGCTNLANFSLSGSKLTSINLGTANNLALVQLKDCDLNELLIDYVLLTLDGAGRSGGQLDLTGNSAPSATGMIRYDNLKAKGWTVNITEPGEVIPVSDINITGAGGIASISTDGGTLQLLAEVLPYNATDKTITWSVTNGSMFATVDDNGIITASGNGTITVRGTANDGSGVYEELFVLISNQITSENENDASIGKIIVNDSELIVLLNNNYNSWKAGIYNFQGILLLQKYIDSDVLSFDISRLTPGLFLIVLSRGESVKVAEFIKP